MYFTIGVMDDFTIDSFIIYSVQNGMFMDSSYRKKNEHRAPIYFIGTATDKNNTGQARFVPCMYGLSAEMMDNTE